ncbi:hypothetical protein AV530_005186 [Patagioenas fasciata monilis]|uniref:Uncharacterized protein n=1 Tax=Patagioenas fasciata monilis TaxID=372326 RepID=A0A1V4K4B4_PATFA|nr:hypothetical protein AV530_005186 [Patagioenas fasciata monilis]
MDKLLEVGDAKLPEVTNYLDACKPKPTNVDTTQAIAAWNAGLSLLQVFFPRMTASPALHPNNANLNPRTPNLIFLQPCSIEQKGCGHLASPAK